MSLRSKVTLICKEYPRRRGPNKRSSHELASGILPDMIVGVSVRVPERSRLEETRIRFLLAQGSI